jgi:hypothetical protein
MGLDKCAQNPNRTKALLVQFIAWLNEWHGYHLLW